MKKIIYMAVAAIAVLSSCSSEEFTQSSNGINGEAKVFTGTIESESGTRTTLTSENKVNWVSGDKVNIGGAVYTADQSGATTTFTGAGATKSGDVYKAYYPSSMYNEGTITLPASYTYDGNFNMPMYAESTSTSLGFKNLCGVLAITVPSSEMSSVSSIVVSSDNQLNGAFTATSDGALTFESKTLTDADKKITLTVATGGEGTVYYIPVPAGSHTLKITVNGVYDSKNTSAWMTTSSAVTIERSKKYSIEFSKKHSTVKEYVDFRLSSGLKWATCNVGAENPQDYGLYFAWGETAGHSGVLKEGTTTNECADGYSYNWASAPFNNGQSDYSSDYFTNTGRAAATGSATGTTLVSTYDAATVNWGGSWRMPTSEEFLELARGCYIEWTSNYNSTNVAGFIVYKAKYDADKGLLKCDNRKRKITSSDTSYNSYTGSITGSYSTSDTHIFLPEAGYRNNTSLFDAGSYVQFWSSTLYSGSPEYAFLLYFKSDNFYLHNYAFRYFGRSVRAVCSE